MKPFALHSLFTLRFRQSLAFLVVAIIAIALFLAACDKETSKIDSPASTDISTAILSYTNSNIDEAKSLIQENSDLVVLDVRTQEEYRTSHLPNAILIPLSELPDRLFELNKDKKILVYCKAGIRSAQASKILVNNGFGPVYNMLGGIDSWIEAGYPVNVIDIT